MNVELTCEEIQLDISCPPRSMTGEASVICEDALDVVETLGQFDYVITDPPYPTGGESSMSSAKSIKDTREMIDGLSQSLIMGVLKRVQKKNPFAIWMFVDWRQVSFYSSLFRGIGLNQQNCIVWDKVTASFSGRYHPSHELILYASNGVEVDGYCGKDIVACKRPNATHKTHPFEKPISLIAEICQAFPQGRVLDPFCGTGGLLVGAKQLGWDVVGVDISREFCDIAERRLQPKNMGWQLDMGTT